MSTRLSKSLLKPSALIKTIGKLPDTKVAGLPGDISKPLEPIFGNVKFGELWKGLK